MFPVGPPFFLLRVGHLSRLRVPGDVSGNNEADLNRDYSVYNFCRWLGVGFNF